MRYVIVGAGAVGGAIGGHLARAGRDVVLVARGAHLEALQAHGLDLRTPHGRELLPIPAVASVAEVDWAEGDIVVLGVKGQHTDGLLAELDGLVDPETPIVCAQNGVANERRALRRLAHVHGVCVMLPAVHLEPGVVAAFGDPMPGILDIGLAVGGTDAVDEAVAADLTAAGYLSMAHPTVMRAKYRKLIMNLANAAVAVSGMEAATGSPIVAAAMGEGEAVLAHAGIDVASRDEDAARRKLGFRIGEVAGIPRGGGSTWQSLARGTGEVEVDTLNGEIVLQARLSGTEAPINEALRRVAHRAAREGWEAGALPIAELEALVLPA